MSNWIYVCNKDDIEFEDVIRFDYKSKTYCIYNIEDVNYIIILY